MADETRIASISLLVAGSFSSDAPASLLAQGSGDVVAAATIRAALGGDAAAAASLRVVVAAAAEAPVGLLVRQFGAATAAASVLVSAPAADLAVRSAVVVIAEPANPYDGALPRYNGAMDDALAILPSYFAKDPEAEYTLFLGVGAGTCSVRIDGALFEVLPQGSGMRPFSCDLRDFTLDGLAARLQRAGYAATAAERWRDLAATTLVPAFSPVASQHGLASYTSALWRILRPLTLLLDLWGDDLQAGLAQMDVRYAEGRWLDWWGVLYGVQRAVGEGDDRYRRRIVWEVIAPRCNNVAMEHILKEALGYDARVTDGAGPATTWYAGWVGVYDPAIQHWQTDDPTVLGWGARVVGSRLVPPEEFARTWPGQPGTFKVAVAQVVEDDALGVAELTALIERYKAAGFTFTLSIATHYAETYATGAIEGGVVGEWSWIGEQFVGRFAATGSLGSPTGGWPLPPAIEARCDDEWSSDGGATWALSALPTG